MTILTASLYLPYTANADFSKNEAQVSADLVSKALVVEDEGEEQDAAESSFLSAGSTIDGSGISQILGSDGNIEEEIEFFLQLDRPGLKRGPSLLQGLPTVTAIAPNVPHSPVWGQNDYFNQPHLHHQSQLPPASVLQRDLPFNQGRPKISLDPIGEAESRSSSYAKALKSAKWSIQPAEQGNGGLRNAVYAATLKGDFEHLNWVGTLSMPTDALNEDLKASILERLATDFDSLVIYPKDSDFDGHYSHFCKMILWPVFHYQIPDSPKSKAYLDHSWVYYVSINQSFADKIVKNYKRGDVVWVHDYHLLLVPKLVREKLPDAQIGFFLHIAFPSSEVFRCLAFRRELLEGMLGANLIGFQTQEYSNHFLQTCNRLLRVETTLTGVQMEDRFVDVGTFPIGIDPGILEMQKEDPEVLDWVRRLESKYAGKKLIVGRDKLDHIRGVRQKLLSFEILLRDYPQFRENVVMIQVATTADAQPELATKVAAIVTRINCTYGSLAHQPMIYLKKDLAYQQYIAMLESADVLMITSLREGMDLTAHEYVLCQDGSRSNKKHGAMVLSEFTGSAAVFDRHDLAVNPWDYNQCAEAMSKALSMSSKEKERRWTALRDIVLQNDANHWIRSFLSSLRKAYDQQSRQHTVSIPRLHVNDLAIDYRKSNRRLFLLDCEGTLTFHGTPLSVSFISPERTLRALNDLLAAPGNTVYVMSGRMPQVLDQSFKNVAGLGLVGENGCFIKHPEQEWICLADMEKMNDWKISIENILTFYQQRIDGSVIEVRNCSIFFNTANAKSQDNARRLTGECANHLNDACANLGLHAIPSVGGLLIESTEFNKRLAAEIIFQEMKSSKRSNFSIPDFLMVAGDAREDEVVYRWANELKEKGIVPHVCTVSVSSRNTEAVATLTQGVTGVLGALQNLAAVAV